MKKQHLYAATASALLLAAVINQSHAADVFLEEPQGVWSGFYVGAAVGTGAVNHDAELLGIVGFDGLGGEGFFGEVTVGYDHLLQNGLLLGAAINARYGNIGPTLDGSFDIVETDPTILTTLFTGGNDFTAQGTLDGEVVSDYGFDVIGRVGVLATPQSLFYVLGGYSWQNFDASIALRGQADIDGIGVVDIDEAAGTDWSSSGFVIGAGIETAITERVHLKTEYRYSRYASEDFGLPGIVEITPTFHTVTMGLNYRFGTPQPAMTASSVDNFDWTGVYVTAAGGAQALVHDVQSDLLLDDGDTIGIGVNGIGAEGILGEIGVGADFEFGGGFVVGAQASARWANTHTRANLGPLFADINADFSYDIVGRAGYKTSPNTLVYALGGWSRQEFNVELNDTEVFDETVDGFVVGGGIETALTDRIVAGLEYRYAQYSQNYALPDILGSGADLNLGFDPSFHSGRATVKFKLF
ncbi:MAG: outer membrane beta-barrel protein [Hyphomonas sp.]|nr:outer membrane beta-barrel protein [Hyphomonas sp.]